MGQSKGSAATGAKAMKDYRQHLREITVIQTETIKRLTANGATPPLEVAAVLEDIANQYLNISDEIRNYALSRPAVGV